MATSKKNLNQVSLSTKKIKILYHRLGIELYQQIKSINEQEANRNENQSTRFTS